jgi:hypothetical protein
VNNIVIVTEIGGITAKSIVEGMTLLVVIVAKTELVLEDDVILVVHQ